MEVLKKLFGKLDIEDEEDASSQIHYDEEDDAFLGVVSKLLQAIEESEDVSCVSAGVSTLGSALAARCFSIVSRS